MKLRLTGGVALFLSLLVAIPTNLSAQTFGIDLHNIAQPASGGMAGVSLASPQDAPSALFGNPATMSQYQGTTFTTGLDWLKPVVHARHDGTVTAGLGGGPWDGYSQTQGFLVPSIAALQDLRSLGINGTAGVGLTAGSGLGESYRDQANSAGTGAEYHIYDINGGFGLEVLPNLSVGSAFTLGLGIIDAGFASTAAMTHAYGIRGTWGATYNLPQESRVGVYYQMRQRFEYTNLFLVGPGQFQDVTITQPDNFGIGFSNSSLMDGNLLLAVDVLYKQWKGADFWSDYFNNQWVVQVGSQYTHGRWKYRAGYSFAENPINGDAGAAGGPAVQALTQYIQGTELAAISKHRITAGVGFCNLLPGLSADFFAGGLLPQTEDFGSHTRTTAFAWYLGGGLTWAYCPVQTSN